MGGNDLLLVRESDIPSLMEGAGVVVRRVLGPGGALRRVGPFPLLDHTDIPPEVGFPLHPHSGFEVLTYILRGELKHKDSEGFQATVGAGGAQHLFTGRGVWHEEMPGRDGTDCLQVWVDLPSEARAERPSYRSVLPDEVPVLEATGAHRRLLAGPQGAVRFRQDAAIEDVTLEAETTVDVGPESFLYGLSGGAHAALGDARTELEEGDLLVVRPGGTLLLTPRNGPFRFGLFEPPSKA